MPRRAIFGIIHARGSAHTRYHVNSTGDGSVIARNAQPHAAAMASGVRAWTEVQIRLPIAITAARESVNRRMRAALAAGSRNGSPPISPPTPEATRTISWPGAIHESCPDTSINPSVGLVHWRKGRASASHTPAMTAPYIARTRRRRSGGAFATMATTTKTSGTTALAFTDIPSAREIAASNSRRAKRNDTAHATKNATRMSLWPPPTT